MTLPSMMLLERPLHSADLEQILRCRWERVQPEGYERTTKRTRSFFQEDLKRGRKTKRKSINRNTQTASFSTVDCEVSRATVALTELRANKKIVMFPITSTDTIRGGRAEDYFILPLYFRTEYLRITVNKNSIAENMIYEQFWPMASMTNYLMSRSKMF